MSLWLIVFPSPLTLAPLWGGVGGKAITVSLVALVCVPLGPSLWLDLAGESVQPTC